MPLKSIPEIADVHDYAALKPDRLAYILCEFFKVPGKITATQTNTHECAYHQITREQTGSWADYVSRAGNTVVYVSYRPDKGGRAQVYIEQEGEEVANFLIETLKARQAG